MYAPMTPLINLSSKFVGCSPWKLKVKQKNPSRLRRSCLTPITDPYHGLHCKKSTDHKDEVGHRSSEVHGEIHSGTFTRHHFRRTWISHKHRARN